MLRSLLVHPLTIGLDIDDPRTTQLRREIIQEKGFLRRIYQEWYSAIAGAMPQSIGPMLELGSGAGFLKDFISDLVTSEIFWDRCVVRIGIFLRTVSTKVIPDLRVKTRIEQ